MEGPQVTTNPKAAHIEATRAILGAGIESIQPTLTAGTRGSINGRRGCIETISVSAITCRLRKLTVRQVLIEQHFMLFRLERLSAICSFGLRKEQRHNQTGGISSRPDLYASSSPGRSSWGGSNCGCRHIHAFQRNGLFTFCRNVPLVSADSPCARPILNQMTLGSSARARQAASSKAPAQQQTSNNFTRHII